MIQIRFWGVRGSIAGAGPAQAQVGGNTSCVEVRCGEGSDAELLILDAGTGLRELGARLVASGRPLRAELLISHYHWDHIQGFPFFGPAYVPGNELRVHGPCPASSVAGLSTVVRPGQSVELAMPGARDVRGAFEALMRPPHFPVGLEAMGARLDFELFWPGTERRLGGVTVRTAAANHPNGCLAYRIEHAGGALVFATDTEPGSSGELDPSLLELARGADLLIYDAQYTTAEYLGADRGGVGPGRQGWGHSTAVEGARLARAAGVKQLALFHHDPSRDDWAVARIEAEAQSIFPATLAAREGQTLRLGERSLGQAA